jgi:hypothetical protein
MAAFLWFDIELGGQRIEVWSVPENDPRLAEDNLHACAIPQEGLVLVGQHLRGDALYGYLLHEILHVVDDISGASYEITKLCEKAEVDFADVEERLARYRTPVMHGLLKRLCAQFPLPPSE